MSNQPPDPEKKDTQTPDQLQVTDSKSSVTTSSGEDWETRYNGLMKTVTKKDGTITDLQGKLEKLSADLEELRTSQTATEQQKATAEKAKTDLEQLLTSTKTELTEAKKSLSQQTIIMNEFSQLGKLAKYITPAVDDKTFTDNAKSFSTDLEDYVQARLKGLMAGSSPPQPKGKQEMATEAEEDALYKKVTSLAGISGKEAEYEEARQKWVALQQTKSK